ncbi:hypothetical protein, partial [Halorussus litoreus]|uniref:hypothetical protein n=1 Tax=Halorussus litoreus TaxID=1710536 RepID=UPI0018E52680
RWGRPGGAPPPPPPPPPPASGGGNGFLAGADDPLVVLALATFHTALLVAAIVAGLHFAGPLGELLDGLQTSLGLGLYIALWATTWWTNRRWLGVVADPESDVSSSMVVGTGGKWGGVNGVFFFWVLFFAAVVPTVGFDIDATLFYLLALGVGTLLALGIGGIVGVLAAAVDLALFRVADRLGPDVDAGADAVADPEDSTETS